MWPAEEDAAWPAGVLNDESVSAFIALFESIGYEVCGTADFDAGFLKVALYADAHGIPTHAAVQREDGSWASKLGAWEDISHRHPATVGGGLYGEPVVFLRRPVSA